jgi:hypothetical protein
MAVLQPGVVSLPVGNRQFLSDLQMLDRHFSKEFVEKFGNQNYHTVLNLLGKKVKVNGRDFYHHESRGKIQPKASVNAQVTAPAAGADVTVTLQAGDHFNSGTQSPIRVNEVVRISTSGIEGKIVAVNKATPNAHTATIRPLQSGQAFVSAGSANLNAGELLLLMGVTEAGERSSAPDPQFNLTEKVANTTTEVRDVMRLTDRNMIERLEFEYNGQPYFKYKGMKDTQLRFLNDVEFKLMFGDIANNLGAVGGSVGTQGVIPRVRQGGTTISYTPGSLGIPDIQTLTRTALFNGGPDQYHGLVDIYLRQEFNNELFSQYGAGAINYGSVGGNEEMMVSYGFKGMYMDGYSIFLKTYAPFSPEAVVGAVPATGVPEFRNFGLFLAQGSMTDPQSKQTLPNVRLVYNAVENEPEIKSWETGAYASVPNGEVAELAVHWLCYPAVELMGTSQNVILEG